jgi:hypothetical protein
MELAAQIAEIRGLLLQCHQPSMVISLLHDASISRL